MGLPVYIQVTDSNKKPIEGECAESEHKGWIMGFCFRAGVSIPTDPNTGQVTGGRVHAPFVISKEIDKSSPELFNMMCKGEKCDTIVVDMVRKESNGREVTYYKYTFKNAQIVRLSSESPDVRDVGQQFKRCQEEVEFRYQAVTVQHLAGKKEATDYFPSAGAA